MNTAFGTPTDLAAITPTALFAYARNAGWSHSGSYGEFSDILVHESQPEIVVPRTQRLTDYPRIVSQLVQIFAAAADASTLSLLRELLIADRDVIRLRAIGGDDGHISTNAGVSLIQGARDMVLAAACSVVNQRPVYRPGANREASQFVERTRLGQTEEGSFVVALLGPSIPPILEPALDSQMVDPPEDPAERVTTSRVATALLATRRAAELAASGDTKAFDHAVRDGTSANLCEALALVIEPFRQLEVSFAWARTRPKPRDTVAFSWNDVPILNEASRSFRAREPRIDSEVYGFVHRLKRSEAEIDGTVTIRAPIDNTTRSITAVLPQTDYSVAVKAHDDRAMIIAKGDLEQIGNRWRLLNPTILGTVENQPNEETQVA